jgi:hypothetical protein
MGEKQVNTGEKRIILSDVLEQEIRLYAFENAMVSELISSERKYQEAQRRYEEILASRTWRYSAIFRKLGTGMKLLMRRSALGRAGIRVLKLVLK